MPDATHDKQPPGPPNYPRCAYCNDGRPPGVGPSHRKGCPKHDPEVTVAKAKDATHEALVASVAHAIHEAQWLGTLDPKLTSYSMKLANAMSQWAAALEVALDWERQRIEEEIRLSWGSPEQSGTHATQKCERCDGDGWVEVFDDDGFPCGGRDCDVCAGTGRMQEEPDA